ncbi:hypothetical protein D9754_16635 [Planomicrobium sp. Y74]|nr:hypothetical protein D9754_16635 [Planomicrobium sp. Y74]
MTGSREFNQGGDSKKTGELVLICSAVGGVGKTAITANLAILLTKQTLRTVIVDGNLQFGDIALALDIDPVITIKEVVEQNGSQNITEYCLLHKSGIRLLAGPTRPEYAELITADALASATEAVRKLADVVLVEVSPGFTEQNMLLMDKADSIILVTTPGMPALKNTKLMIETLASLGMQNKISLIVNKSDAPSIMTSPDISELFQIERTSFLPYFPKEIAHSMDIGVPLTVGNPKHRFSKQLQKLADQHFSSRLPADIPEKRRIRDRFKSVKHSSKI